MKKSKIRKYLAWLLVFAFICSSLFVTIGNAEAAGRKNIKSATVRIDGKKVTKKTVTLRKGEEKDIENFSFSPQGKKTCYLHIQ